MPWPTFHGLWLPSSSPEPDLGYDIRFMTILARSSLGMAQHRPKKRMCTVPLHVATSTVTTGRTSEAWLNCESLGYHWEV